MLNFRLGVCFSPKSINRFLQSMWNISFANYVTQKTSQDFSLQLVIQKNHTIWWSSRWKLYDSTHALLNEDESFCPGNNLVKIHFVKHNHPFIWLDCLQLILLRLYTFTKLKGLCVVYGLIRFLLSSSFFPICVYSGITETANSIYEWQQGNMTNNNLVRLLKLPSCVCTVTQMVKQYFWIFATRTTITIIR